MTKDTETYDGPQVLLLGGGYTLKRVAALLGRERVVMTTTTKAKRDELKRDKWNVELFHREEPSLLRDVVAQYPRLSVLVDGIPPPPTLETSGGFALPPSEERFFEVLQELRTLTRWIYLSTTGVSGVEDGSWVDERTVPNPKHERGWARLLTEERYRSHLSQQVGVTGCVLRLPAIYGPGRGVVRALREGRFTLIADRERWTNRIHVSDLASIIARCTEVRSIPELLYLSDDEPVTQRIMVEYLCQRFGLPAPREIPWEEARKSLHHTQLSNQRVRNAVMKRVLGMTLRYPSFREGADEGE